MKNKAIGRALFAGACVSAFSSAAFAQAISTAPSTSAASTVGESAPVTEIVVTAQKREQRLQDVPLAITVVGAAQLEQQQITEVHDLDRVSPAVTFVDGAPGGGASIRGIGTQSFTPSAEASVGIVVDGVPQGNVNANNIFDVERVEILRGPQGMLFGQSTSAGVINMVTTAPAFGQWSGRLHVDYADDGSLGANYGEQVIQGVVNVPLGDTAAVRVSAFRNRDDGVEHDPVTGQKGVSDDDGFRLRLLDQITPKLRFNLIVDYDRDDQAGPNLFVYRDAVNASTISALAACGVTASPDNTAACPAHPVRDHTENGGASAQFDYDLGGYTLTSITAFRGRNDGPAEIDIAALQGVFPQLYYPDSTTVLRQDSQELRITSPARKSLEWVAGVYLARSTDYADNGGINIVIPDSYVPSLTDDVMQKQVNRTKTDTGALFGQATYHFTSKLSAFVGLRANSETVSDNESFSQNIQTPIGLVPAYNNVPQSSSTTSRNLSGRVGLQYRINHDLMLYGTATRGYKGPQVNDTVFGDKPTIVKPEIPTAFEVGAKGQVHGVGIDFNVFYDRVKDYQGQLCVFTPELVCGSDNVSQVTTKGVELDLFGRPIRNLTLNGGFIYNPVKYPSGYIGSDGTDIGGAQLTGAPLTKLTLSGEYLLPTVAGYQGFVGADMVYESLIHVYPSALSVYNLPAHTVVGARIGVRLPDGKTRLELYGRNLGNVAEPVNIYPGPTSGDVQQIVGKEGLRIVGLSLDTRF